MPAPRRKPSTDKPAPTPDTEAQAQDQPAPPNAVVIHRIEQPDGGVAVEVVPVGDVKVTEVQTILAMAAARWRSQIGL